MPSFVFIITFLYMETIWTSDKSDCCTDAEGGNNHWPSDTRVPNLSNYFKHPPESFEPHEGLGGIQCYQRKCRIEAANSGTCPGLYVERRRGNFCIVRFEFGYLVFDGAFSVFDLTGACYDKGVTFNSFQPSCHCLRDGERTAILKKHYNSKFTQKRLNIGGGGASSAKYMPISVTSTIQLQGLSRHSVLLDRRIEKVKACHTSYCNTNEFYQDGEGWCNCEDRQCILKMSLNPPNFLSSVNASELEPTEL